MTKEKKKTVGEEVYDRLVDAQYQEVGETVNEMAPRYMKELESTIDNNIDNFESPFYIVVLRKKEPWTVNLVRQWFVARQTRPDPYVIRDEYKYQDIDLWKVDSQICTCTLEWTLPPKSDMQTFLNNKDFYDKNLIQYINEFNEGTLK